MRKQKRLTVGALALFALGVSSAMAENPTQEPKVDITSFNYTGSRTRTSEICGKVSGNLSAPVFVRIVVDEKTKRPGIYNVLVGSDGAFCAVVTTYAGTASASVWPQQNPSEPASSAQAIESAERGSTE